MKMPKKFPFLAAGASFTLGILFIFSSVGAQGVPPSAPTGLSATGVSDTQIDLSWADNSDNEDGFKIERCTGYISSCADINFSQIGSTGANVTTYSDTGLPKGTTYTYRVRAFNATGNSDYSNKATAGTLGTSGGNVKGWAWAKNIGWIHFQGKAQNGSSYGVKLDETTNDFSGYAWSENLGWLSFERADTGNPPAPPADDPGNGSGPIAKFDPATNEINGWARFLSNGNGWDGWVKLSGNISTGGTFDTTIQGEDFHGFAWGAETVGWISFNSYNCDVDFDGDTDQVDRTSGAPGDCTETDPGTGKAISHPAPRYFVTFNKSSSGGGLSVTLTASPNKGKRPLNGVSLTADVKSAVGNIKYEFDCENDGVIDDTATLTATTYTSATPCNYPSQGVYNAVVIVTDESGAPSAFDFATITVLGPFEEVRPE